MAIGDILEGLLAGAAGGVRGYSAYQQEEAARREREAEREAARLEREEIARRQQEQADRLFNMQVQRAVAEGILSPTEYVEYAEPSEFLRGEAIGMQRPAAGADMSSILADQPIGMQRQAPNRRSEIASALSAEARDGRMEGGAMVAPGQTYSAIDRVLAEAEPTPKAEDIGARDTERPARGLDRVLDITPEDIASRFERAPMEGSWTEGRGTFEGLGGQMYRAVTPEERAEAQRRTAQSELDTAANEIAEFAKSQFDIELSPEAARAVARQYIDLGDIIPEEPKPSPQSEKLQNYYALKNLYPDMPENELLTRAGFGLPTTKGPELPPAIAKTVAENEAVIDAADRVLNLSGTSAGEGVGARFNIWGLGGLMQRFGSEEEKEYRARVANIGTAIRNALAGASLTQAEYESLAPYVPDVGMEPEDINARLRVLKERMQEVNKRYYDIAGVPMPSRTTMPSYSTEDEAIVSGVYDDSAVSDSLRGTGELLRPSVIR